MACAAFFEMSNKPTDPDDRDQDVGLEPTDVLPPARLLGGKYRLGRLLGEGGMGAVYEAEHTGLGTTVAVKLLNESFANDHNALSRFRREARAAAAIRHENVVAVFDTGTDEQGIPFIVMELLSGESLSAYLRREHRVAPKVAVAIGLQLLAGLAAAHEKRVIHRDLKPGNVLLADASDGSKLVKILDFGISKVFADPAVPDVTATGAVIGTPRFMAPEQARGQRDLDARVDLYSVGVLLYRMVTGKLPFGGTTQRQIIDAIIEGTFPPPREIEPTVPRELERTIVKALSVGRDQRHASAEEFMEELRAAMPDVTSGKPIHIPGATTSLTPASSVGGRSVPSLRPVAPADVSTRLDSARAIRRARRRRRVRWASSVAVAAVVAAALGWGVWKLQGAPNQMPPAGGDAEVGAHFGGSPLRLGITRYLPREGLIKDHQRLVRYLARRLQRPVQLKIMNDYVDLADKLNNGEIEIAALASYAYVRAARRPPGLTLLATHVTSSGTSYEGYILSRAESDVQDLQDLRGRIFCYVSPSSTSGYLYPRAIFRRHKMDPDSAFKTTRFTGDHLRALRALHSHACDGAAVFAGMLFEAKKHGMPPERFRILASTKRIPYDAYCVAKRLDSAVVAQLRAALLALEPNSELARKVLGKESRIKGFAQVKDGAYDPVRKIERFLDQHNGDRRDASGGAE